MIFDKYIQNMVGFNEIIVHFVNQDYSGVNMSGDYMKGY